MPGPQCAVKGSRSVGVVPIQGKATARAAWEVKGAI